MCCLIHNWHYFKPVSKRNGKNRYCKKCGKHQKKEWLSLSGWENIYSFNWETSWGFNFLKALNLWHSLTEGERNFIEHTIHHKSFTNDDIACWYVGRLR